MTFIWSDSDYFFTLFYVLFGWNAYVVNVLCGCIVFVASCTFLYGRTAVPNI